ncbi:MAG TPA: MarR family transcriptional regulator [Dokdonella sp.]|jgi:predicted transcriptional regulator|uniref:HVO_A0114 family putative DNA-binding protein n=1 Tax=Dokdonella sp. TaxID=2291710 RepID=UPI0025C548FB|nr:MarR family transcriptional regulator [Dokdonella sp.]HNV07801.1 MarR family transcriptional regulator [Dokdonella sp.]HPW03145.1 MarR family transcriptional regulator [Dokdonella sp.]HQV73783.1 MarR family transcriptional regulator [Dokdonella sp.]HQW77736.1 MarR family transcriptional regulator [Dokdonella sp.]
MSRKSKLLVHVGGLAQMGQRFVDAWQRAETGCLKAPERHLTFGDLPALLAVLTPKRWELLRALRARGASSVRALAQALGRDYKRVHSDVAALEAAGLIDRDEANLICVAWDAVDASLDLAA